MAECYFGGRARDTAGRPFVLVRNGGSTFWPGLLGTIQNPTRTWLSRRGQGTRVQNWAAKYKQDRTRERGREVRRGKRQGRRTE